MRIIKELLHGDVELHAGTRLLLEIVEPQLSGPRDGGSGEAAMTRANLRSVSFGGTQRRI